MNSGLSSSSFEVVPQTSPSQMQPGKGRRDTGTGRLCCQIPQSCRIMEQKMTVVAAHQAMGLAQGCGLCAIMLLSVVKCVSLASAGGEHLFLCLGNTFQVCVTPKYQALLCFVHLPVQQVRPAIPTAWREAARCIQGML